MDSVFIRLAARGSRPAARVSSVGGRQSAVAIQVGAFGALNSVTVLASVRSSRPNRIQTIFGSGLLKQKVRN